METYDGHHIIINERLNYVRNFFYTSLLFILHIFIFLHIIIFRRNFCNSEENYYMRLYWVTKGMVSNTF